MSRSRGLEGAHGIRNAFDLECEPDDLPDRPDSSRMMRCCVRTDATALGISKDHGPNRQNLRNRAIRLT